MKKGFTLMELLVVISVIAILIAVGITSYASINKRSRDARRKSDIEQVRSALELYRSAKGYYPDAGSGTSFVALSALNTLLVPDYIPSIPKDPKDDTNYPYKISMRDLSNAHYYGYCLSSFVEDETLAGSNCGTGVTLPSSEDGSSVYNYGVKNP